MKTSERGKEEEHTCGCWWWHGVVTTWSRVEQKKKWGKNGAHSPPCCLHARLSQGFKIMSNVETLVVTDYASFSPRSLSPKSITITMVIVGKKFFKSEISQGRRKSWNVWFLFYDRYLDISFLFWYTSYLCVQFLFFSTKMNKAVVTCIFSYFVFSQQSILSFFMLRVWIPIGWVKVSYTYLGWTWVKGNT